MSLGDHRLAYLVGVLDLDLFGKDVLDLGGRCDRDPVWGQHLVGRAVLYLVEWGVVDRVEGCGLHHVEKDVPCLVERGGLDPVGKFGLHLWRKFGLHLLKKFGLHLLLAVWQRDLVNGVL